MPRTWPKGSEWRKWDLHLHAPGTKLNDQFDFKGGDALKEYCRRLHESDVRAFGIADYFSADCYLAVVKKYREIYADSEKVLFPNVEVRLNESVNKKQEEIHLHLIFNPFMTDCDANIRKFLQTLKTNRTDANGRNIIAAELTSKDDYEGATTTRVYLFDALRDTFGKNVDLLDWVLIVTAANSDGIRAESGKQRKANISDEVDKDSNAFFGNAGNVDWFLRGDRYEDNGTRSKPKPVLSGCDAHSFDDLDQRLGKVASHADSGTAHTPTWIKADLTYEGLKQIIFEPANRVFIGEEPEMLRRVHANPTRYVKSLHISKADGYSGNDGIWFNDEQIVFNNELVAIIGNKGSGKSALTDVVGLLGNTHNQFVTHPSGRDEELFSFLNKEKFLKGGVANHFTATLEWHNGTSGPLPLGERVDTGLPERVEYLPQKYLERLCANISDEEFRKKLNEVVFRYVKAKDQHGCGNLEELLEYLSQQASAEIDALKEALHVANRDVVRIERRLTKGYRDDLDEKLRLKREEVNAHLHACPLEKPKPAEETGTSAEGDDSIEKMSERIDALEERIAALEEEQEATTRIVEQLRQARKAIEREANRLKGLESQYETALRAVGLKFEDIVTVAWEFVKLDEEVSKKQHRLNEVALLLLTDEDIEVEFADDASARQAAEEMSLVVAKARLADKRSQAIAELKRPEREYQQYISDLSEWRQRLSELRGDSANPESDTLRALKRELKKVKNVYPDECEKARSERSRVSTEVFRKKRELTEFYNSVKHSIDLEIAKYRNDLGEYVITVDAGLRFEPVFFDEFLRFINQAAAGSFRGVSEGRAMLQEIISEVTDWEDEGQVFGALARVTEALWLDIREGLKRQKRNAPDQLKGSHQVEDVYDYLFAFDYLKPKYDLKVDKKFLSELSPGERGGLLLIFYLMLDRQDIPLIIDQPEDNLDNESVYKILARFIVEAKKRRQIILVTHNPNLAVVADAEQIIHVSIDKTGGKHDFDFMSGAIEDQKINEKVVTILEGTLPAFDNRRLKYRRSQT